MTPYPKAPSGARLAASLVDLLIASGPFAALALLAALLVGGSQLDSIGGGTVLLFGLPFVAAIGWGLYYTHVKDGMPNGQSYGKRAMGLMVVHLPSGRPCTRWQSTVRKLVWAGLCAVPLVGWLVEPLAAILREDGRRLGDLAADTQVVTVAAYERARATAALPRQAWSPADDALREAMREVDAITRHAE